MWFVMFLVLMSNLKEKIIFGCFITCWLVQAFESYMDYKARKEQQEVLSNIVVTNKDILQKLIYPIEDMSMDNSNLESEE